MIEQWQWTDCGDWCDEETLRNNISKKLGLPKPSRLKLSDWQRKELIPRTRYSMGQGAKREWLTEGAADYFASQTTWIAANGARSLPEIAIIRQLSLLIQNCRNERELLDVVHGFSQGAQRYDISSIGGDLLFWTRQRRKAVEILFGERRPKAERERDDFFNGEQFLRFCYALTMGLYRDYKVSGDTVIIPAQKKTTAEYRVFKDFPLLRAA